MRILFDEGTPAPLRHALTAHTVETASEKGWANLSNGDLLIEKHVPDIAAAVNSVRAGQSKELNW